MLPVAASDADREAEFLFPRAKETAPVSRMTVATALVFAAWALAAPVARGQGVVGLSVVGSVRRVSHAHGGAPAQVGDASFNVHNAGARAATLSVVSIALELGDSRRPTWTVRPTSLVGLECEACTIRRGLSVTIAGGARVRIEVSFQAVAVYATWYERFRLRARFRSGGRTIDAIVPLEVTRRQPIERHEPSF